MCVMPVFARYLSSSDNLAPAAGRRANKSAENPANVIIRPANEYKNVSPLNSMFLLRISIDDLKGWLTTPQGRRRLGSGFEFSDDGISDWRGGAGGTAHVAG